MRNRIAIMGALFATVALTAGCDTLPSIDVASLTNWFGDSAPAANTAPQLRPDQQPSASDQQPAVVADAPPQAAPTEKIQADPLPAQTEAAMSDQLKTDPVQTDTEKTDSAQTETAQNLPIDGMQREGLRGAFGVDDKTGTPPSNGGL